MPVPPTAVGSYSDYQIVEDVDEDAISCSTPYYSTNYTESNIPGAGRVLGLVYNSAGQQLERAVGLVAQRIGFRPRSDIIYQKIQELYQEGWMNDEKRSVLFSCLHLRRT